MEKGSLYEGDGILLYCEKANGFVFSPPPLESGVYSSVNIHSIDEITVPGFPNVHYASFKIKPRVSLMNGKDRSSSKANKQLVYGRKVHLYHVASKWYLSFDNKCSYKTMGSGMATLVDKKEDATVFRIIPSDPTKSTGQTISIKDRVRLEIFTEGHKTQALCVPNDFNSSGYDLKKASDGSDFTIYSQSSGQKLGPPLALRGGEVVMFLNEKRGAFLTILKDEDDDHVVARVNDGPNRSTFTGGDSYWQIENSDIQYDGNWVDWEIPWHVCIKHLPTKKYLVLVEDDGKLCFKLAERHLCKDEDSVFHFEEDRIDSDMGLLKRRYVLIKHVKTNNYVTLGKGGKFVAGTRCFEISPQSSTDAISDYRDQKFWIEEVDEEVLKKFSTLYGAFIVLHEYLGKLIKADRTNQAVAAPTHIMSSLAKWTNDESSAKGSRKRWPDMLRAMKGVDLVLEFLNIEADSVKSIQKDLCTVLENYIKFASNESQLYLIVKKELLDTLLKLMGRKIGAESVLSALIRCNSFGKDEKEIVLEKFFHNDTHLLNKLENNKDFEFLKCLSALCLSGGKAEREIQCNIVKKIIIKAHEENIFFKITRVGEDQVDVIKPKMFKDDDDHLNELIIQIELYASVCEGVNLDCIELMTRVIDEVREDEILTYRAANICWKKYTNSPAVQSAFYGYLVSSMVDKNAEESGIDLDNIWYIYSWTRFIDPAESYQPIKLSAVANTHDIVSDKEEMINIQNEIQESLEKNWSTDIEADREDLMAQRLRVLETLVAYGFYWKADVDHEFRIPPLSDVINSLINLLGYPATEEKKAALTEEKKAALTKLQSRAIKVLNLFLHQTYHLATSRLMFDCRFFNKKYQGVSLTNQNDYYVPNRSLEKLVMPDFQVERSNFITDHISQIQAGRLVKQRVSDAHERLNWILYEAPPPSDHYFPGQDQKTQYDYKHLNIYDKESEDLQDLLITFLTQKNDQYLLVAAAKLFFDLFKGESFMFNRSKKSLIVLEGHVESWESYTTMVKYATYQDKRDGEPVRALLRLSQGKGATDEIARDSILGFAEDVIGTTGKTTWPDGTSGFQPRDEMYTDLTGQKIILTTGVFGLFLNYVVKYATTKDQTQLEIVNKICSSMISVLRGNDDAKEIVFGRFEDLMRGIPTMANMLTEVLTDNISLCRKLPHSTIWKMFRLVTDKGFYEFIPTIEAWTKVSKSSPHLLKANQRFVTTLYEQHFKDYHETGWDPKKSPLEMLREDDNDKFILLTHLLAVCCEGIHKYSEDCARHVFDISTLIKIIVGDINGNGEPVVTFPLEKRLPFVMILNEAFLRTERESLVSVLQIAKHEQFWQHVENVIEMIKATKSKLDEIRNEAKKKPKLRILYCQIVKMKVIFSQHFTHMYWKDHRVMATNLTKKPFKEETIDINGNSISLGILYQYILEGVLPMLTGFAEEYTLLWQLYKERVGELSKPLPEKHGHILFEFGKEIKSLVSTHGDIFVPTEQLLKYWEASLKSIFDGQSIFSPRSEAMNHHLNVTPFQSQMVDKSDPENKLKRQEEAEINSDFKIYLDNYKKLIDFNDQNDIEVSLYPTGPGFQKLLEQLFPLDEDKRPQANTNTTGTQANTSTQANNHTTQANNHTTQATANTSSASTITKSSADESAKKPSRPTKEEIIQHLVELLNVLHKQIQQQHDSKELGMLNDLVINILQVLSGVLYKIKQKDDETENDNDDNSLLREWQNLFRKKNVHKTCMSHLNHDNPEIVLQILGILRLMTLNANVEAQDDVFDEISDRDSAFCRRVHGLLEGVISTFSETWAKMEISLSTKGRTAFPSMSPTQQQQQQETSTDLTETNDGIQLLSHTADTMPSPISGAPSPTTASSDALEEVDGPADTGTLEVDSLDNNIRTASIVLDCLSALCDGQHRKIQGFLFDQDQSFKKLDIIKRTAVLLDVLTEEYEKVLDSVTEPRRVISYLELIEKAIQALIETTAGNYDNQQAVFQCQITDTVNVLLGKLVKTDNIQTKGWKTEDTSKLMDNKKQLSLKSIELLQVLLEETHDDSLSLIANFTEDVNLDVIIKAMLTWKDIGAYHILRLIANSQEISVDCLVTGNTANLVDLPKINFDCKATLDLWNDFKARSRCIEVLYQPNKEKDQKILTKVYFDFDPLYEVREEDKEIVTNSIIEESQEESLTEFNKWGRSIRRNASYMYGNYLNNGKWIWVFRLIYETSVPRHLLLVFLTVLLNLLVLSVFIVPEDRTFNATGSAPNFILFPFVPNWYYPILLPILGGFHIILSLWMVVEFIVKEWPNFTSDVFFINAAKSVWNTFTRWFSQQEILKDLCPKDWRLKQKRRNIKQNSKDKQNGKDKFEEPYYYEDEDDDGYFKVDFFGFQSMYRIIFLFCSLIAIPLRGYPYCICLFYVFLNVDVVQHILEALSRSRKQLFFVALISASVLLVFAIIGFVFIHDYFEASSPLFCNTLWECFISVSREGLLDTLGPAIPFTVAAQGDDATPSFTHYSLRTIFYDLPFFLVVTTIVLNIVTAVLIDRFSDLRGERDTVESKKTKACFICGIETETFERYGKGFRDHVKEEHNKWNYIYYLIYLDRKAKNDLTALEKQIANDNEIDKKSGKTDHYPIKKAKVLPKDKQGDND